jgi:hypothetical protein
MSAPGESHFSVLIASFEHGGAKIRYFAKKSWIPGWLLVELPCLKFEGA